MQHGQSPQYLPADAHHLRSPGARLACLPRLPTGRQGHEAPNLLRGYLPQAGRTREERIEAMTRTEARKAIKLLEANGCREGEIISLGHGSYRIYATDNATGYRFHDDSLEHVQERIAEAKLYLANATDQA